MSPAIKCIDGIAKIHSQFDGLILDLWGCLHDGVRVYDAALDCLKRLRRSGQRIVIMSNAPRRSVAVATRIAEMGLTADLYDDLVASGEETWHALHERSIAGLASARRVFAIMTERDASILDGIDLVRTEDPGQADFVLAIGIEGPQTTIGEFDPILDVAIGRNLPMVCANPDLMVHRGGIAEICAGAIAQRYQRLGGRVVWFGKPHAGIYQRAIRGQKIPPEKFLCVGDSLRTDIAGGAGIGAFTLFIGGGIHEADVMSGGRLDIDRLSAFGRKIQAVPDFAMPYLAW